MGERVKGGGLEGVAVRWGVSSIYQPTNLTLLHSLPSPRTHPGRPLGGPSSLGLGCRVQAGTHRPWVWGSALHLPLSLSRGGLYFILFVGRLGLLSGFNDLCHYL